MLYIYLVRLEPVTLPSNLLVQGEEVPFKLELIGNISHLIISNSYINKA